MIECRWPSSIARAQGLPGPEQVLLADELVERARAHALGERLVAGRHAAPPFFGAPSSSKPIAHRSNLAARVAASPLQGTGLSAPGRRWRGAEQRMGGRARAERGAPLGLVVQHEVAAALHGHDLPVGHLVRNR